MEQNNLLHEEPTPQILSKHIFNPDTNISKIIPNQINNGTINELPDDEETILNIGDDTEITDHNYNNPQMPIHQLTNLTTTLEDIFKATIHQMKVNNKTQVDIDQCCYDFSKEISRLKISKDQTFQIRMIFDICKRQLKEKELYKIIERCKIRVDESVRTKGFNRLIEDANRRLEAQEQLELMKGKLESEIVIPTSKKYKDQQWKEIYNERFLKYQNEKEKKNQKLMEEKKRLERKKEKEIIELCKVKKAPLNVVEEYGKRLYEDQKTNKDKDNNKGHVSKSNNKIQEDKEIKEPKVRSYKKHSSIDNAKKTCEDEDNNGIDTNIKSKEELEENRIKKEVVQSVNQIEFLKVNLKDNAKEKSKSQEKLEGRKIHAFSVNKKEPGTKMKKLRQTDFLPNNNSNQINNVNSNCQRRVYDDKQTNKILNHFFENQVQVVHHS